MYLVHIICYVKSGKAEICMSNWGMHTLGNVCEVLYYSTMNKGKNVPSVDKTIHKSVSSHNLKSVPDWIHKGYNLSKNLKESIIL